MSCILHPEAAAAHEEQVRYYEAQSQGLGGRYHSAFLKAAERAAEAHQRYREISEGIRKISLQGFPFKVVYRLGESGIQILAVAPFRRRPGYWSARL